jgi:hypothetical protein
MFRKTMFSLTFTAAVLASVMAAPAMAQPADKRTIFTFSGPVTMPGITLPAGSYLFRFVDRGDKVVQVTSADGKHVYGMFLTLPADRPEPVAQPHVQFMETATGMPAGIAAWWYPGERSGHEFMYPKEQAYRLAHGVSLPTQAEPATGQTNRSAKTGTASIRPDVE